MLTSPMLQNSPNNISSSAVKSAAHAASTRGDIQAASFGKTLAREMNNKGDASETQSADMIAAANNISEDADMAVGNLKNMTDAKDSEELKGSQDLKDLKELEDSKDMKDLKDIMGRVVNSPEIQETSEMKVDTAAASLQLTDLAGILHGLIAAYRPEGRIDAQANTATDAANASSAIQADLATAPEQQASLVVMQPGLVAAHLGKDGKTGISDIGVIADTDLTFGRPGVLAATSTTSARAKQASDIQDIRNGTATKLGLDIAQANPQQMEFGVPAPDQSINTVGLGKSLLELASSAPKDSPTVDLPTTGLPNTLASLTSVPIERSIAPAAGAFVHTALGLEPRVGVTGWDNALGQKVLWMVSNQQQVAELNLNPPDLGPLQVVLSVTNDQASAIFVSQHADVRQALEAALPRLKEMMADSGISLGETTVSADTSQRQGGFEQQDRSATRHGGSRETMAAPNVKSTDIGASRISAGGNRLVDTFA